VIVINDCIICFDHKLIIHLSALQSVRKCTRCSRDSNGTIVKEVTYDSFGKILSDSSSNLHVKCFFLGIHFGFVGGLYDHGTKLIRFGYRDRSVVPSYYAQRYIVWWTFF